MEWERGFEPPGPLLGPSGYPVNVKQRGPASSRTPGALITVLVPLTFFLLVAKYFIRGILAGALKG